MSISIYAGGNPKVISRINEERAEKAGENKSPGGKKNLTIYAGNLNALKDSVEEKRKQAREKAWKIVSDTWNVDKSIDESVQLRRDAYEEQKQVQKASNDALIKLRDEEAALKEQYKIEDGSKEQEELELLKKEQDVSHGVSDSLMTDEEMKKLAAIDKENLTEYQKRALELNDRAAIHKKDLNRAEKIMENAVSDITRIGIERLKKHMMVDANKDVEEMMAAASDEIVGGIVDDAKEHVDEKLAEEKKKAEEVSEEKKEEEEELAELKEERAIEQAVIEGTKEAVEKAKAATRERKAVQMDVYDTMDVANSNPTSEDMQQSLNEIKNSMNILDADLKGLKVDATV